MDKIIELILDQGKIEWQTVLYELVKYEQMNPWDIDIALLTKRFIQIIHQLKQMDFNLSGKMLLAAALLLKLKSEYLLQEENEQTVDEFVEDIPSDLPQILEEPPKILPKTPRPRIRKISIYELVDSLERAMQVNRRRLQRLQEKNPELKIPEKKIDIEQLIEKVWKVLTRLFKRKKKVKFFDLVKTKTKEEIVYTLMPLLYLAYENRVELNQEVPFEDITIIYKGQ